MVAPAFNPNTRRQREVDLLVQGQPDLRSSSRTAKAVKQKNTVWEKTVVGEGELFFEYEYQQAHTAH